MIAVIGGGLTGLALSRELDARGLDHVVLEAAERPGGIVRSASVRDRILEWGPQRTRLTPALAALSEELGIDDEVIVAPADLPLFVYARNALRRVPMSASQILTSDLLGPMARLRFLFEPFSGGLREGETAGDYFVRKFGRQAYDDLFGPLYGGLYASRPSDMPGRFALARTLAELGVDESIVLWFVERRGMDPPPACSFRAGMQTLTDALARRAGSRLSLGESAGSIRVDGAEFVVATAGGPVRASDVVLTVPADVAGELLMPVSSDLAARLDGLTYNPLAVVHLLRTVPADEPLKGLGYQVSFREKTATRGVTWNEGLFPQGGRDGLFTAYLGGASAPEACDLPDDVLGDLAAAEFMAVTGVEAEPISVARTRMPAWDHSWSLLDGMVPPPGLHLCANWETRPGVPGRLAAARRLASRIARGRER